MCYLFVYISILILSWLFTFQYWFSAVSLHFNFQLFVYTSIIIFSCLFTFHRLICAVCLHFNVEFQLFVYFSKIENSCLFTFQRLKKAVCVHLNIEFQSLPWSRGAELIGSLGPRDSVWMRGAWPWYGLVIWIPPAFWPLFGGIVNRVWLWNDTVTSTINISLLYFD